MNPINVTVTGLATTPVASAPTTVLPASSSVWPSTFPPATATTSPAG